MRSSFDSLPSLMPNALAFFFISSIFISSVLSKTYVFHVKRYNFRFFLLLMIKFHLSIYRHFLPFSISPLRLPKSNFPYVKSSNICPLSGVTFVCQMKLSSLNEKKIFEQYKRRIFFFEKYDVFFIT